MAFETYLLRGFENPHESTMFANLVEQLRAKFATVPGKHILIGNVMFEGNDLDALFLKSTGICIIEMKAHGGQVVFRENAPWIVGRQEVFGGSKENPFQQVRAYRFGLAHYLQNHERDILQSSRPIRWDHIFGLVVFGQEIQFEERFLNGLRIWFGVTDLSRVAGRLAEIGSAHFSLTVGELETTLKLLGIDERYRYLDAESAIAPTLPSFAEPQIGPAQLVYLKEFQFREHEARMRHRAGARSQGAQRVRELFEEVRQGLNPFVDMPNRTEDLVLGATVYPINAVTELVLIRNGLTVFPAFLGEPIEVTGWLAAHAGLVVAIDAVNGRISVTRILNEPETDKLQSPALTTDIRPLLTQIAGLQMEQLVPVRKIRAQLLELDETSPELEIRDTLEMVADSDVRAFLLDIINMVRAGDHAGAEARLRLRLGTAIPVEDAGSFAQDAAGSGANSDQALVINALSKEELDRLLDPKHFQDWMLFLHPDQKTLAESEFDRPVVLTGVSGSGKTCILVHRARHLARKYPGQKIGILTLSRTLRGLLQNLVNLLLTEEERRNVTVHAFYDVFRDCLKHLGPEKYFAQLAEQVEPHSHMHTVLSQAKERWPNSMVWNCDPISHDDVESQWDEFYMSRNPTVLEWMDGIVRHLEDSRIDASRYLEEEFTLIRGQFAVPSRDNYLNTEEKKIRAGRAIPFRREMRQDVLRLLLFWEEWLLAGGMIDDLGLSQALMPLHNEMQRLPNELRFRCLLVDEFQDFSTLDLQLFRRIVPLAEPDALFLAGDTVQKILVKRQSLRDAALDSGAAISKSILKNYRNSKQVLRAASQLANHYGAIAKSQDEEIEILDPELAQRETNPPIVLKTDDQIAKAWEIALECTQDNKTEPWTVCIATASPRKLSVSAILQQRPTALAARSLSGDCILHPEEVVVGTISDLKGFEFRLVLIIGCDADNFPEMGVPRDEVWRDALRLYVAMTRGRDQVYLLHADNPSEFISILGDTVLTREEQVSTPYLRAEELTPPQRPAPPVPAAQANLRGRALDWDENCETWFKHEELEALHRYFARHVYRDGLTFHEWMKPRCLCRLRADLFYRVKHVSSNMVSQIMKLLRTKGVAT